MTFPTQSPRSDFMGNPIVLTVTEKPLDNTTGGPISFHQVHLHVSVSRDGTPVAEYDLSKPFTGNKQQTMSFDISSCFRAAAEDYEYEPVTGNGTMYYPVYTASVYAYSSYIQDGARHTTTPLYPGGKNEGSAQTAGNTKFVIGSNMGRFSDFERRQSADNASLVTSFSRKPESSPELVFAGDTICYAESYNELVGGSYIHCPSTSTTNIPQGSEGTSLTLDGHQYYVVPRRRGSVMFQFVNSRGCIESIRAFSLPSEKGNAAITDHTISRFETFGKFSRNIKRHQLRPAEFSLSSGHVDYQWARWWYYEFCQSEHVWMLVDQYNPLSRILSTTDFWLPVNIQPSDSTTIIDPTKPDLLHVDFTVIPDMNGPLV